MNEKAIEKAQALAGYNLFVTSEIHRSDSEVYHTYHNLWRIEESFRIMKSQLEARPVYLQKEDTITGHFLICYLAVLLTRLLQFKVLGDPYCSDSVLGEYLLSSLSNLKAAGAEIAAITANTEHIVWDRICNNFPLPVISIVEETIKELKRLR